MAALQAVGFRDVSLPFILAELAAATHDAELGQALEGSLAQRPRGSLAHLGVCSMAVLGPVDQALAWVREACGAPAATAPPVAAPLPAPSSEELPAFTPEGDVWRIRYQGREIRLKATRGVEILAHLVARPDQDVHVLDLVHPGGGRAQVDAGDAGEAIDAEARDAYRARVADLQEDLEEARAHHDLGRVERLEHELDALTEELPRSLGLGGRPRRGTSAAERARVNVRKRPWAKLARHRAGDPLPSGSGPLPIGPARPAEAEVLADLFCDGFDLPDAARPLIGALVGRPAWDVLVAREGDAVVGLGLAFDAHGGTALEGGVTAPAYRGQGIQGAIMAARVRRAFDRGASWVSSETGVAVPGQPNSSWRNMERCGLRPLGEWHNLVPRGARWAA